MEFILRILVICLLFLIISSCDNDCGELAIAWKNNKKEFQETSGDLLVFKKQIGIGFIYQGGVGITEKNTIPLGEIMESFPKHYPALEKLIKFAQKYDVSIGVGEGYVFYFWSAGNFGSDKFLVNTLSPVGYSSFVNEHKALGYTVKSADLLDPAWYSVIAD